METSTVVILILTILVVVLIIQSVWSANRIQKLEHQNTRQNTLNKTLFDLLFKTSHLVDMYSDNSFLSKGMSLNSRIAYLEEKGSSDLQALFAHLKIEKHTIPSEPAKIVLKPAKK